MTVGGSKMCNWYVETFDCGHTGQIIGEDCTSPGHIAMDGANCLRCDIQDVDFLQKNESCAECQYPNGGEREKRIWEWLEGLVLEGMVSRSGRIL